MTVPTDFTHYQPPGVYIEEVPSQMTAVVGVPPTVIALVGVAVGYRTASQQFTLSSVAVVLNDLGVIPNSIVMIRLDTGATVDPADYTVSNPTGSPLTDQNYTTAIARASGATTPDGTSVVVTYNYQAPDYFTPVEYDDFEDVKDAYGEPLNFTPPTPGDSSYEPVLSPVSLAAQIAFQNGAASLVIAPVAPPTGSDAAAKSAALTTSLTATYSTIESDPRINVVVPVTRGILPADAQAVASALKNHVEGATTDGYARIGIIGFDPSTDIDPAAIATATKSKRVVLAYGTGGGQSFYVGATGQTITLGDGYLAAAYGGVLARVPVQKALTKETVVGFLGLIGQPLSNKAKNTLADAGVAVTQPNRFGNLVIRHGTSTDRTNVLTREISITRGRDAMVDVLSYGLDDASLLGEPITGDTPLSIKGSVANLLEVCVSTGVIVGYTDLKVRVRSTDPSVIEVKFAYQPAFPLNYIVVSFSVDTTTGAVDLQDLAA